MSQHFLLSSKARTLSLAQVLRLTEEQAFAMFVTIRWANNGGEPVCPKCGCVEIYKFTTRRIFKCKGCTAQFSATSSTIFASRKLSFQDMLAAIAVFTNGAKGHSALQLSRDLDVQYRTAFVLQHKLREAMASEVANATLSGTVEIDGAYFGGHVKPANYKEDRKDRRLTENQTGKRKCVVVMRQRKGRTITHVAQSERAAVSEVMKRVQPGTVIHADEAMAWDSLHDHYEMRRINHSVCYSDGQACTNGAESFFSRLRRAELGTHHSIRKAYLSGYAAEMGWREDHRREANGAQFVRIVNLSATQPVSRQWKGYWQRHLPV
ncbi:MAG: IS1595 family transposase [Rhizomicrobium sp.]